MALTFKNETFTNEGNILSLLPHRKVVMTYQN